MHWFKKYNKSNKNERNSNNKYAGLIEDIEFEKEECEEEFLEKQIEDAKNNMKKELDAEQEKT